MNGEVHDDDLADTTIGTASETAASSETVTDGDTETFDWEGHDAESTALAEDDRSTLPSTAMTTSTAGTTRATTTSTTTACERLRRPRARCRPR